MNMWSKTTGMRIDPPQVRAMPGRLKTCRRKDKDEPVAKHGNLSRKWQKMHCKARGAEGHNKKGCPSQVRFMFLLL